ncbi:peptidylprolyl isomerase [Peristeroidobacter soli]|jgi:peptidyl-prolyl cis-trans isomerase A (cyclophilin A)/peptidyl-prolyl cis-trans isomerase B (cyclophilin B)|uniref:peptidylprolyl isomerase n=1 Tax=Peristeroidobacter soli TaxID=2497877 RepID=UPI00101DF70B|nr:peptidylprolyl isomerase [Peristeroidobacter soli]
MLEFKTTKGTFTVQLFDKQAPITVENFYRYADEGFFDGTIFHRVIPNFMVQGGGLTEDLKNKKGHEPIQNEATNGLKNKRGTLSMARTNDINSATSQFFINVVDNDFLDHKGASNYGYAVFGRIDSGMEVVDAIVGVKTGSRGGHQDVPVEPIIIESVKRIEPKA